MGRWDNLHALRTRQQHMAEEVVDKLMTVLLTLVPKQKKDANLYFFLSKRKFHTSNFGSWNLKMCICQWEKMLLSLNSGPLKF